MKDALAQLVAACQDLNVGPATSILPHTKEFLETPIELNNIKDLHPTTNTLQPVTFIDGGSNDILRSSSLNIQVHKIAAVTFKGNTRIKQDTYLYFLLTQTKVHESNIIIHSKIIPQSDLPSTFILEKEISYDDSILTNDNRLSQAGSLIRKWNERNLLLHLCEQSTNQLFVLDGKTYLKDSVETGIHETIASHATINNNSVIAFAKTATIFANNGMPAQLTLKHLAPQTPWYYTPLTQGKIINALCKLHSGSRHIFYIEILQNSQSIEEIFKTLQLHSQDPAFPGYPYGLIVADQLARVSNEEAETIKAMYAHKWSQSELHESTQNAHDILDSM